MASILCIETSTEVCSVALAVGGNVLEQLEDKSGKNHAQLLTSFVENIIKSKNIFFSSLDAIAVSGGPGSYTGLRIGVSTAKGLCYASDLPLIAIPSLESMAHHVITNPYIFGYKKNDSLLYCPMIDARRMEVFDTVYNNQLIKVRELQADIIDHLTFSSILQDHKILFFGNGSEKCKTIIQHPNALFLDGITTSAGHMARLAEESWLAGRFVDVAYYEPFYLKDFVATIPTKNIFRANLNSNIIE